MPSLRYCLTSQKYRDKSLLHLIRWSSVMVLFADLAFINNSLFADSDDWFADHVCQFSSPDLEDVQDKMHRWSERFISCHSDAGNDADPALRPVCGKYRVHLRKWFVSLIDGDTGGIVVSV